VRTAERLRQPSLAFLVPKLRRPAADALVRAAAEGLTLAAWDFRELKTDDDEDRVAVTSAEILAPGGDRAKLGQGLRLGTAAGAGANLTRTLQARPGNVATPSHLASEATAMCEELGMDIEVLGPEDMKREGMKALLAVAQGSAEEPRLIVMRYEKGKKSDPPVALVGKGLTFDAGGISLKPAKGMEEMKYDMSGGAAVIGAMKAIALAKLRVNVIGVVPSSENMPSGTAVKPGDVIGSLAGKTIEVINTDAEGRLILADALAYTAWMEPAAMVDCATLTGACVIALGHHASAVMGSDDRLVKELIGAGERSGERCWHLPTWPEYRKQLDSPFADLKNVGGAPGGSITAGCFLKEFTGDVPWAHLDIAGTAWGDGGRPYLRKGPQGVPTRQLFEWVRSRVG
jgi:leucyl aminopeptidase